ncbi:hypothetical protein J2045_000281 [Peteryoungia aggregata LMG 23059]|uniref:Uncharacterized protein n=1 Tax=Peteryoungia aggregata LMG 23059 TaxID=1368425 RepID=A0ABU0G3E1_9HYPH|nr:hypothetical protein [Peteryoungia aggregata LMG 23059]
MTSSEEVGVDTIHVRLLDEPVSVWRPVKAKALGNGRFVILPQEVPDYEKWEFAPGETVAVEAHVSAAGDYFRAVSAY